MQEESKAKELKEEEDIDDGGAVQTDGSQIPTGSIPIATPLLTPSATLTSIVQTIPLLPLPPPYAHLPISCFSPSHYAPSQFPILHAPESPPETSYHMHWLIIQHQTCKVRSSSRTP